MRKFRWYLSYRIEDCRAEAKATGCSRWWADNLKPDHDGWAYVEAETLAGLKQQIRSFNNA